MADMPARASGSYSWRLTGWDPLTRAPYRLGAEESTSPGLAARSAASARPQLRPGPPGPGAVRELADLAQEVRARARRVARLATGHPEQQLEPRLRAGALALTGQQSDRLGGAVLHEIEAGEAGEHERHVRRHAQRALEIAARIGEALLQERQRAQRAERPA